MAMARKAPEWMDLTWMRWIVQANPGDDHKEMLWIRNCHSVRHVGVKNTPRGTN